MRMKTRFAGAFPRESARSNRFVASRPREVALAIQRQYGNDRRQGELLFQVAQFILPIAQNVMSLILGLEICSSPRSGRSSTSTSGIVIPTCDPFNVTLRASNKCKTSCLFIASVSNWPRGARRVVSTFVPFSSLKDHHALQLPP